MGLLKFKQCLDKNILKKLNKFSLNQIYSKNYLSELKLIEDKNFSTTKYFLLDERNRLKLNFNKYFGEIILSYPINLNCKSKIFYPYIIEFIIKIMNVYNEKNFERKIFKSIILQNILTDQYDQIFLDERISFIPEEENLKIYEKINMHQEKLKMFKKMPFNLIYNNMTNNFDKILTRDYINSQYFLILNKHSEIFIFNTNENTNLNFIIKYEEHFKNYFEIKLLEFFAFILHYNKNKIDENLDELEKKRNEEEIKNLEENLNNISFISISSQKKTLLKPFNKEEILLQEDCETDYGARRLTKKELKNREDYIKKVISDANKELFEKVECDIIQGTFEDKQTKVIFCIPNDKSSILNKLN